jgi:hypothetical protein
MTLVNQTPIRLKVNYIYKNNEDLRFEYYADLWFNKNIAGYSNGAGYGLIMLNDKHGGLIPLDADNSGIFIPYDVKNISEININDSSHIIIAANG